jgi:hypothetical protein
VRLWIDDNLIVDNMSNTSNSVAAICTIPFNSASGFRTDFKTLVHLGISGQARTFKLEYVHFTGPSTLQLYWQGNVTSKQIVPAANLFAYVDPAEATRMQLRDRMYNPPVQWGTYNNPTMGDHVQLPSAFALQTTVIDFKTNEVLGDIIVYRDANPAITRTGPHSYNGSDYTQVQLDQWNKRQCTIVIETTVVNAGVDLQYLVSANGTDCAHMGLLVTPNMLWGRAGNISNGPQPNTFVAKMPGFSDITTFLTAATSIPFTNVSGPVYWALPFNSSDLVTFGFSTGQTYTISEMQTFVAAALERQLQLKKKYGNLSDVYDVMQTIMGWNTIYTPYEGVVTPVSRGWDFGSAYVIFHWDNELASYMMSIDAVSKDIAYSNLIQIVQARTLEGLIPNYASGTRKSYDRTEPQLGSFVLARIFEKWNETWIVELLLDSLVGAHNWTWNERRGFGALAPKPNEPTNLVVLGTDLTNPAGDWATNTMQGAR